MLSLFNLNLKTFIGLIDPFQSLTNLEYYCILKLYYLCSVLGQQLWAFLPQLSAAYAAVSASQF